MAVSHLRIKIRKAPVPIVAPVNSRTVLPSIAEKVRNLNVDTLQAQRVRTDFLDINNNELSLEGTRLLSTSTSPISLSLPPNVGTDGQVLTTDGTGILTFETPIGLAYVASNPSDWALPLPTTVQSAIDRIAAALASTMSAPPIP